MKGFKAFLILCLLVIATSCAQQKKYISYTVKRGETMKTIAKRLDMKTKDLMRLNPDVGRRPRPNTVIVIPNKDYTEQTTVNEDLVTEKIDSTEVDKTIIDVEELKENFVVHQVKKGDTFYSLTRFYNVTEDEIKALNPDITDLQLDAYLKIKPITNEEEIVIYQDTIQADTSVRLAMLLPFRAVQYDTIAGKDIFKSNTLANITTDLYLGAAVAVDSLRKQGLDINIDLFDTGRKNTKIDSILTVTEFDEYDAIIGPLYSEEVPKVANRTNVPVVFPVFSRNQDKFNASRVVKTYPDRDIHQKELVDHILATYTNENLLIIGDSTEISIKNADLIRTTLMQHDSIQDALILHPNEGYIAKHFIINSLKAEIDNWVILATDKSSIASDAINSLISLPTEEPEEEEEEGDEKKEEKEKDKEDDEPEMQILPEDTVIKVFASNKSNKFDRVDNNKLAKLGFTFTSDVLIDENSPAEQIFNKQYMEMNNALPSYYATKGFDITYDTAIRLAAGNGLKSTFREGTSYRIESKFDYSRMLFTTSYNNGVFIMQYNPDLTLNRLK